MKKMKIWSITKQLLTEKKVRCFYCSICCRSIELFSCGLIFSACSFFCFVFLFIFKCQHRHVHLTTVQNSNNYVYLLAFFSSSSSFFWMKCLSVCFRYCAAILTLFCLPLSFKQFEIVWTNGNNEIKDKQNLFHLLLFQANVCGMVVQRVYRGVYFISQ